MNVPPPFHPDGQGLEQWYAYMKLKKPADPKPIHFCSWCGEYGDHASANCEKLKGKIANAR